MHEQFFLTHILEWYKKNGRKGLPWRKKNITPYEVWVSEIMLQQTQVSRVVEYYERFLKKFPTITHVAKATWEEFYPYYAGLGYYSRGRNMIACANMVQTQYKGKFPETKRELVALPGIGVYTANAILSFGYGQNVLAVDTNIKKVLGRYFEGTKFSKTDFEQHILSIVEKKGTMKHVNAAIMDFANTVCVKIPKCQICPLKKHCEYFNTQGKNENSIEKISSKVLPEKKFDIKQAAVHLWLHKNHKEYYSKNKKIFEPFILNPPYNSREKIKQYFREKYGLELSVRPPHKKIFKHGKPILFVNAQILMGEHNFRVFSVHDLEK